MKRFKLLVMGIYAAAAVLLVVLVGVYFLSVSHLKENVAAYLASMSDYATVTYDDLSVNIFSGSATMKNIRIIPKRLGPDVALPRNLTLQLEKASFSAWGRLNQKIVPHRVELEKPVLGIKGLMGKPITLPIERISCQISNESQGIFDLAFSLEGLVINPQDFSADFQRDLRSMGYDRLKITLEQKQNYNFASKFNLSEIKINVENMGTLYCKTKLGNIDLTDLMGLLGQEDNLVNLGRISKETDRLAKNITIQSLELGYKDMSLTNKLISLNARKNGTTPEKLRQEIISNLDMLVMMVPYLKSLQGDTQNIKQFLSKPDEIRLTLTSKQPISFGKFERLNSLQAIDAILANLTARITLGSK